MSKNNDRTKEWIRNIILILIAGISIWFFLGLNLFSNGDSMFSNTGLRKIRFTGAMSRDQYTDKEIDQIVGYVKIRDKYFEKLRIEASPQDLYKKISPDTEILFEVHVTLSDGASFSTTMRRVKRRALARKIIAKVDKDFRTYLELKKQGKKIKSLINTM